MSKKEKVSLKNKIIDHIYDAILNDEYTCKDQIKEVYLASKFKVSRSPIREALLELVALGVLEQIERRGIFVKDITNKDIFDTYEAKGVIEGYLATSFAIHATKKDIELLDAYVLKMCDSENSAKTVAKVGTKFHQHYLKYATNKVLLEDLEKLNRKSQLLFSKNWSKLYTLDEIKTRHQKISNIFKTRKKEDIEKSIKEHYFETGTKIVLLR
jgi:DNA-binding GntR family transcriptional regulator